MRVDCASLHRYSHLVCNFLTQLNRVFVAVKRNSEASDFLSSPSSTPRNSSATADCSSPTAKAGTVVTSSRVSKRRCSSAAASTAFALATAAAASKGGEQRVLSGQNEASKKRESVICTVAAMRVLNVLRHWVCKHYQVSICHPTADTCIRWSGPFH